MSVTSPQNQMVFGRAQLEKTLILEKGVEKKKKKGKESSGYLLPK